MCCRLFLEIAAIVGAIFLTGQLFLRPSWRRAAEWIIRNIFAGIAIVWIAGFVLYCLGFNWAGSQGDALAVAPRAMLSALQMFVFQSDLNDVCSECQESTAYMIAFSITHFAALFFTSLIIFKLSGFRVRAFVNLLRYSWARPSRRKANLNVFWGVNDASWLLAGDIIRSCPQTDAVLFVSTRRAGDEELESEAIGVSRILDIKSMRQRDIERLSDMDAILTECSVDLATLAEGFDDIFGRLRLKRLRSIVVKAPRVRFFFLAENEDVNIQCALNMLKDKTVIEPKGGRAEFYVHARKSAKNEIIDHYDQYEGLAARVKIVDSSYLSVASLKRSPECHPVNFVDVDAATATVTSPFSALIAGFGETGQEAFDFLYEFGSFIGPDGGRSPARLCAVDSSMERLAGRFYTQRPALRNEAGVELCAAEIGSEEFWDRVEALLPGLNCVVIAAGDDDMGISLAVDLYKEACRVKGAGLPKFRIFVRCYKLENYGRLCDIAEMYNRAGGSRKGPIVLFGDTASLYTHRLIVDDSLLEEAKRYFTAYSRTRGEEGDWERTYGLGALNDKDSLERAGGKIFLIQKINREIAQNVSNSLHGATKLKLLGIYGDREACSRMCAETLKRAVDGVVYEGADKSAATRLLNVAKCEHLRWEASHKLLGFTPGPEKSERLRTHPCMVPWESLANDKARSYDCCVVDTSVRIADAKYARREKESDARREESAATVPGLEKNV